MADGEIDEEAREALEGQLATHDGDPVCARCSASADFFLYEPDRVAKFVCWEHVSPISAVVEGDLADADRPVAIPLPGEFE
jgi:hypothetical protein